MTSRRLPVAASLLACSALLAGCTNPASAALDSARNTISRLTTDQSQTRAAGSLSFEGAGNITQDATTALHLPPVTAPAGPVIVQRQPSVDCAKAKCVALTFDDGPGKYTDRLLDILARTNVKATFYLLGQNVGTYPDAVRRMVLEGHQLGNHTYDHQSLTGLSPAQVSDEIDSTRAAIRKASGVVPDSVRPPYGAHDVAVDELIDDPLVLWDVDTLDWQHHDPAQTVSIAMDEVHSGSIILMHDIHETSVQAVPKLIAQLQAQGYTLVTVNELFDGLELEQSTAYAQRPAGKGA